MKKVIPVIILIAVVSSRGFSFSDTLFAVVNADTVTIWNKGFAANCAARFTLEKFMPDSLDFNLTEIDTVPDLNNCVCLFDLSITLSGMHPGRYTAIVGRLPFGMDVASLVGIIHFDIVENGGNVAYLDLRQSDCGGFTSAGGTGRDIPSAAALEQNYPNPFNPSTTIQYDLPRRMNVCLSVYDILGRTVATIVNGIQEPGRHAVKFDGSHLANGVYVYRLAAGSFVETKIMVLMK